MKIHNFVLANILSNAITELKNPNRDTEFTCVIIQRMMLHGEIHVEEYRALHALIQKSINFQQTFNGYYYIQVNDPYGERTPEEEVQAARIAHMEELLNQLRNEGL